MSIFPMVQPTATAAGEAQTLPLCQEVAWDFEKNIPIFCQGEPVTVTGNEAVKVWIWKAIHTARYRYEIYSSDYGSELESLTGQAHTSALKGAEAPRYLKECLLINPYITAVTDVSVTFDADRLTITGVAVTIYGEVAINATV